MSRAEEKVFLQYSVRNELLIRNENVCVPDIDEVRKKIIFEYHDVSSAGYPSIHKTPVLVKRYFYSQR